ncbi:hypothetical protein [Actinosynnema sp. NPDC020468]|uniref:hypothetical protein n=1 Tax=Actinosynnema sp. NPDC020468 TaxID=3154488 RepID=UPI0034092E75
MKRRVVAIALAVAGTAVFTGTADAAGDGLWITRGYWDDQAQCVQDKNALRSEGVLVTPAGQTCAHDTWGYYYRYLDR